MFYALAFGLLLPFVARMNEQLARHVGQLPGAWGPHIIGAVFGAMFFLPFASQGWTAGLRTVPWWGYLGGVVGSGMVVFANLAMARLGTAGFLAVNVAAQLAMSLVVDHYGWAGSSVVSVSPARVAGVLLLILGAVLVVRG